MTGTALNPFRPTRWEHHSEGRQLIWFTKTAEELVGGKSVFVYGSRGSGKTSLLRGICWEDLAYNASLKLQRSFRSFNHIGLYVRFPDHMASSMYHPGWRDVFPNSPNPDLEYHSLFSLIVESICIERALEAVHQLRLEGLIGYSPLDEVKLFDDIIDEYPKLERYRTEKSRSFTALARAFREIVRDCNQASGRGMLRELMDVLPNRQPGEMLARVSSALIRVLKVTKKNSQQEIQRFKFCFDDCEVLNQLQRKSLITLVRTSKSPVSWVIASVGRVWEDPETFIPSQPLTDADRKNIFLDDRDDKNFRELCQAVVSLRLLFTATSEDESPVRLAGLSSFFPLDERLGQQSVNALLHRMLIKSNRPIAGDIVRAAEILDQSSKEFAKGGRRSESDYPPYYEAYILLHWRGREDSFSTTFGESEVAGLVQFGPRLLEPVFSAWLRRKQQNALLQISRALRVQTIPLGGANNVIMLADGSIRDFLEIMGEIYEAYGSSRPKRDASSDNLRRFATGRTQIAASTQTRGIYNASSAYFDGIANRSDVNNDATARLVAGLAELTSLLQSATADARVLASAERGVFLTAFEKVGGLGLSPRDEALQSLLRQAELAGYLRPIGGQKAAMDKVSDGATFNWAYRLHRRFSPKFRFSIRGAYEPVRLLPSDLAALCIDSGSRSPEGWALELSQVLTSDSGVQFTLPLEHGSNDET